jgi:hypothetical protein
MKKMGVLLRYIASIALAAVSLVSCSWGGEPALRASFEHIYGGALDIRVIAEGPEGDSLDAASVVLVTPGGSSILLSYDTASAAYSTSLYGPESGAYTVSALSAACDNEMTLTIPFLALTTLPSVSGIADAEGNSAFSGESLTAGSDIAMSWLGVTGATAYLVRVHSNAGIVLSRSVSTPSLIIGAGALDAGSYSLSVQAQAVAGDPLLRTSDFYAASGATSASIAFTVVE